MTDFDRHPEIDVTIDGADECDENLNLIKGGGGCQTQEKIVAYNSKTLVIVADYRKKSKTLGENWTKGVPLEILPFAYPAVVRKIEKEMGGKPKLRMAVNKAGPEISDFGNFLVDVQFGLIHEPHKLDLALRSIPGVLETGLFCNMAKHVFLGQPDGSVLTLTK